jgi:hypothetical protein
VSPAVSLSVSITSAVLFHLRPHLTFLQFSCVFGWATLSTSYTREGLQDFNRSPNSIGPKARIVYALISESLILETLIFEALISSYLLKILITNTQSFLIPILESIVISSL